MKIWKLFGTPPKKINLFICQGGIPQDETRCLHQCLWRTVGFVSWGPAAAIGREAATLKAELEALRRLPGALAAEQRRAQALEEERGALQEEQQKVATAQQQFEAVCGQRETTLFFPLCIFFQSQKPLLKIFLC